MTKIMQDDEIKKVIASLRPGDYCHVVGYGNVFLADFGHVFLTEDKESIEFRNKSANRIINISSLSKIKIIHSSFMPIEDVIQTINNIKSGDKCKISVMPFYENKYYKTYFYDKINILTKLRDENKILFGVTEIPISKIVSIKLIESNNVDYHARQISQEDAKKICKKHYEASLTRRLNYLFDIERHFRTGIDDLCTDKGGGPIKSNIIAEIIHDRKLGKSKLYNDKTIIQYLGDSIKTDKIIEIINRYSEKSLDLCNHTASWFYNEHKDVFIDTALKYLASQLPKDEFDDFETKEVIQELKQIDGVENIVKLVFTYKLTTQALEQCYCFNFIDYTLISFALYKLTEIVFNKLLVKYWSDKKIISIEENKNAIKKKRVPKKIDLSSTELVLGEMKQFLFSTDREINEHLLRKRAYKTKINERIGRWLTEDRNGYLHKHILCEEDLKKSIESTFVLLFLIVLVVKK